MKKINVRNIPEIANQDYWDDYQPLLEAFGNIVVQVDDDDYQGDSRLLYSDEARIGYLQFGWGSCSGCDALQACDTLDQLQELADHLTDDFKIFESKSDALQWFLGHDWEGDYHTNDDNQKKFVKKAIEWLHND